MMSLLRVCVCDASKPQLGTLTPLLTSPKPLHLLAPTPLEIENGSLAFVLEVKELCWRVFPILVIVL
ncbi:hypothetical protein VNO77_25457 [Canavalia gladiata]|uniref:Uncharacterized protein n=1 Tax=Canavalia gladiata TaxID=3824 RepID=A0AAN9LDB0_CANGL